MATSLTELWDWGVEATAAPRSLVLPSRDLALAGKQFQSRTLYFQILKRSLVHS